MYVDDRATMVEDKAALEDHAASALQWAYEARHMIGLVCSRPRTCGGDQGKYREVMGWMA